jgi:hypothetical protein
MDEETIIGSTGVTATNKDLRPGSGGRGPESEVVLLATYKLLPQADTASLSELWSAMHALVTSDPRFGFLGSAAFSADDGTRIVIYRFSSVDGLRQFRRHPEHIAVQRRGSEYFQWLRNEICTVVAVHPWTPAES